MVSLSDLSDEHTRGSDSNTSAAFNDMQLPTPRPITDALEISVEEFQCLRSFKPSELEAFLTSLESVPIPAPGQELPELSEHQQKALTLLATLSRLTQEEMASMNEAHPGLPPDTFAKTWDLVTRPGASVVLLRGDPDARSPTRKEILGFGLVIAGKENFPEWTAEQPDHRIPDALFEGSSNHHRLIRLFVRDNARDQELPGRAFDLIIERIKDLCHSEPIIALVLMDIIPLETDRPCVGLNKGIWLAAKAALERRGFEDAGSGFTESIKGESRPSVAIPFRWHTFPPRSESGKDSYAQNRRNYGELAAFRKTQVAGLLPYLPVSDGLVNVVSSSQLSLSIATLTGATIYAQPAPHSDSRELRQGRRYNLIDAHSYLDPRLPFQADAIVLQGVLPEIALSGQNPQRMIQTYLCRKVDALKEGGILIIRDTIAPSYQGNVRIYLGNDDHFTLFSRKTPADIFRSFCDNPNEISVSRDSWGLVKAQLAVNTRACFEAPADLVAEFLLKYPYLPTYPQERDRPYTLHDADGRTKLGSEFGLRLIYAAPEFNPYLERQHREAGISIHEVDGRPLRFPSNFLSVWQKVGDGAGTRILPRKVLSSEHQFVAVRHYRDVPTGATFEVASRPGITQDIIPFSVVGQRLYVWGRVFPRPIITVHHNLDESQTGGYVAEQLAAIRDSSGHSQFTQTSSPIGATYERVTGRPLPPEFKIKRTSSYFPCPYLIDELVESNAVQVPWGNLPPNFTVSLPQNISSNGSFGTTYSVSALEAVQVLQGAQVGHFSDARLERKVYQLLLEFGLPFGAWIGEPVSLIQQKNIVPSLGLSELTAIRVPRRFERATKEEPAELRVIRREFDEECRGQNVPRKRILEYVEPSAERGLSHQSITILPIAKVQDRNGERQIVVGLELVDLPAVQEKTGSPRLATIPTVRVPKSIETFPDALEFGRSSFNHMYGERSLRQTVALGGKYFVSPGITPEVVYPLLAEVNFANADHNRLTWVALNELLDYLPNLYCAQLITSAYRAAHLLELFPA
jgi:hypothetical protein